MTWAKRRYGRKEVMPHVFEAVPGRWVVTNGHMQFDVHFTISGSNAGLERHKDHPDGKPYIVSPEEADDYAQKIVDALNYVGVRL